MKRSTFDNTIDNFDKFAKEVFSGNDEDFKSKLLDELELLTGIGTERPSKKLRINPERKVELPNEIWIKIIKSLHSKDVYGSLAFVNKHFNGLSLESGVTRIIRMDYGFELEKCLIILKDSRTSIEIISDKNSSLIRAISITKNLKSLKLTNDFFETRFDHTTIYRGSQLSMDLVASLKKSKNQLEHLELKGIYASYDVMVGISKIKTLKTFKITNARRVVLTPEVINALADNDNQLEIVEFDDINEKYCDPTYGKVSNDEEFVEEYQIALNNFLLKKCNTLKRLKNISKDKECDFQDDLPPLTGLSLCHKLEEFCGYLTEENIEILSSVPKLKRLQLKELKNPKYLLDNLNLENLKYLSLDCNYDGMMRLKNEIERHLFPILQRLYISCQLSEDSLKNLISNTPRLKSIQLWESQKLNISNEFLYEICKEKNVLVIFGEIMTKKTMQSEQQSSFEKFLVEQDLAVFGKYSKMKMDFLDWFKNNPDYGC